VQRSYVKLIRETSAQKRYRLTAIPTTLAMLTGQTFLGYLRHTPYMEIGSAVFAWSKKLPFHPWK